MVAVVLRCREWSAARSMEAALIMNAVVRGLCTTGPMYRLSPNIFFRDRQQVFDVRHTMFFLAASMGL